ncbi:MAG: hypothetical protein R3280_12615 [Marinobacter sp.]|uniref:hypothetical protein n=1 Tax=Marinobacter sp. TaxID=50741 RepID=UPI00299DBF10|nr:hypothetical protein [Marinobacter sp.]MDX1635474.1 hypothetical protein [Marinobacter sp.]
MPAITVEKSWVAGIASAPLYVVTAVLISGLGLVQWFVAFLGAVIAIAVLYRKFVVQTVARGHKPSVVLAWWGAAQMLFIAASVAVIQMA